MPGGCSCCARGRVLQPAGGGRGEDSERQKWLAWTSARSWTRPVSPSSLPGPRAPLQEPIRQTAHPREIFKQKERAVSTTSISSPQPGESSRWV